MTAPALQVSAPDRVSALALKGLLPDLPVEIEDGPDGGWTIAIGSDGITRDRMIVSVLSAVERWLQVASVEVTDVRIGERLYVMRRDRASANGDSASTT